jgi:hypothetical protein
MLDNAHRQTTAYHPESNGAVKRLHRRLKDALCVRTTTATWAEEILWVLLGLRAQPREDTGLSPAEAVFCAPIVLPNEFLKGDEIPVDTISKKFHKSLDAPAFSLSRHNLSRQLPSELLADLLNARLIWVWRGGGGSPSPPPLRRPLCRPPLGTLRLHSPDRAARGDHCHEPPQGVHGRGCHAWQPQTPRQTAGLRRDGRASWRPPRWSSCFQASLVLRPAGFFTIAAGAARELFSSTLWGGFCMPRAGSSIAASTKAVSAAPAETTCEDQPLTLYALLLRPALRGEPCGGCLRPWLAVKPVDINSTLYSSTLVHSLQSLYISCYVFSNKPLLS